MVSFGQAGDPKRSEGNRSSGPFAALRVTTGWARNALRAYRSLLLVNYLVVGIDHIILRCLRLSAAAARRCAGLISRSAAAIRLSGSTSACPGRLVQRGSRGGVGLVELVQRAADGIDISASKRLTATLERRVQPRLGVGR
jgi:hypothetical protein